MVVRHWRKVGLFLLVLLFGGFAWYAGISTAQGSGLNILESPLGFSETVESLEAVIIDRGLNLFAKIDHSENARSIDQVLRPTQLLIFGNPAVGTPLMQCDQQFGIDLPQKFLIWEDSNGNTQIAYNDPFALGLKHGSLGQCFELLENINNALNNLIQAAIAR